MGEKERREMRRTYDSHGVAGGKGEDVGAGDDAGAGGLELGLDGVDDVVAAEALVERRVLLRRVVGRGVQKNRALATLHAQTTPQHSDEPPLMVNLTKQAIDK